jgi:hypothetical protein
MTSVSVSVDIAATQQAVWECITDIEHAHAQSHGSDYRCTLRVEPPAEGSTLSFHFSATPLTLMAKIMGTLMAPLMRGAITKALQGDLNAIKAACERPS